MTYKKKRKKKRKEGENFESKKIIWLYKNFIKC